MTCRCVTRRRVTLLLVTESNEDDVTISAALDVDMDLLYSALADKMDSGLAQSLRLLYRDHSVLPTTAHGRYHMYVVC